MPSQPPSTPSYLPPLSPTLSHLRQLIRLLRPYNTRSMILFYLAGQAHAPLPFLTPDLIFVPLLFIVTYGFTSILNFWADQSIDRHNHRPNAFLHYDFTSQNLALILTLLALLSLILPLFTTTLLPHLATSLSLLMLGILYSHPRLKLSHHPLGKIICMSLAYAYIPLLLGLGFPLSLDPTTIALVSFALTYTSWLLYTDIKDIPGDKLHHKRTLAVILGPKRLCLVSFLFSLVGLIGFRYFYPHSTPLLTLFLTAIFVTQAAFWLQPQLTQNRRLTTLLGYLFFALMLLLICLALA